MKEKLIKMLEKESYTIQGLGAGIVLILIFIIVPTDNLIEKGVPDFWIRWTIYIVVMLIWTIIWSYRRNHFPQNPKGKIGLLISINTENDKQKVRIKNDLVEGINKYLKQHNLYNTVNVITLQGFKAKRVADILENERVKKNEISQGLSSSENDDIKKKFEKSKEHKNFVKLHKKLRCHFYIWGKIKERKDKGNKYYLNLEALVLHKPLNIKAARIMKGELNFVFPKEISIPERKEFEGFEIASNLIYIATLYIIGVAAILSGDLNTASILHNNLQNELNRFHPMPLPLQHISENLKGFLLLELLQQARFYYYKKKDFDMAKKLLSKAESIDNRNYDLLIFISLYAFKIEKDIEKSLEYLKKASKVSGRDYTWLYDRAFLYMYTDNYKKGIEDYKKLAKITFSYETPTVDQCIEFDKNLIEAEPNKYQLLFILGYLYYCKKNDLEKALAYFKSFKKKACNNADYRELCIRVDTYINLIEEKIKNN